MRRPAISCAVAFCGLLATFAPVTSKALPGHPGEPLVLWKEGRCDIVDPDLLQDAFEAYLEARVTDPAEADSRSRRIREAVRLLGPGVASPQDLGKAYGLLQHLAADPIDEGRCRMLLNAVVRSSRILGRNQNPGTAEKDLRRQKEILEWNARIEKKISEERSSDPGPRVKGKPTPTPSPSPKSETEQRLAKVTEEISGIELGAEVSDIQVRLELQDLAFRFLQRGDYDEAILAIRFYRGLFADSIAPIRLGPDEREQIAPRGASPNLGDLENLAAKSNAKVAESLARSSLLLDGGYLVSAAKQLSSAFALGSRTTPVRTYHPASKEIIRQQLLSEKRIRELMAQKDYAAALATLDEISRNCRDFDTVALRASIESSRSLAAVRLAAARQAVNMGRPEEALRELREASAIWPYNPELPVVAEQVMGDAVIQRSCVEEFDRLHAARQVMEIERQRGRLEPVIASLPGRQEQLLGDLREARLITEAMERGRRLRDFGSLVGGWEVAEEVSRRYPGQQELENLRKELLPGVEPLAKGINEAQGLEGQAPASALARYLSLQRSYPQSVFAAEGVSRVSAQLLGKE
jgi:tetratricopeptide (TPR) repeat protein